MWSVKLILLVGLQVCVTQVLSQDYCINPSGNRGICYNIRKCEPLLMLLRSQPDEAGPFLRMSVCGYEGNDPKVCCPVRTYDPDPRIPSLPPTNEPSRPPTRPNQNQENYDFPQPPYCGFSNATHKRVVGGDDAQLGAWPWIAVLGYKRSNGNPTPKWLCGGSIISKRHILTAGHCIYQRRDLYLVRVGDLDLNDKVYDQANPQNIPVEKATHHPKYNPNIYTSDIGIIKLKWDIQFDDFVKPICLPVSEEIQSLNLVDRRPFIAGWGSVTFKGPSSSRLQEVQIPVVNLNNCKTAFRKLGKTVIDDRVLCAGYATGGKDACQGDSGGPLMLPINRYNYYVVGVVSYGYKCAEPGYPGVYSKVEKFLDFIADNMN